MGRRYKGPRLWLRPERWVKGKKTHDSQWLILDGPRQISTKFGENERAEAENVLLKYVEGRMPTRTFYVYFITAEKENFPIKIGISESHKLRFGAMQVSLPYLIKVLAILPTKDPMFERRLHQRFQHLRLRGEWFEQTPEINSYIAELLETKQAA